MENLNIYDLTLEMVKIANSLLCKDRADICMTYSLVVDTLSIARMNERDNVRYWCVMEYITRMRYDDEELPESNVWEIHRIGDEFTFNKIR
jgi:hypothetical protein